MKLIDKLIEIKETDQEEIIKNSKNLMAIITDNLDNIVYEKENQNFYIKLNPTLILDEELQEKNKDKINKLEQLHKCKVICLKHLTNDFLFFREMKYNESEKMETDIRNLEKDKIMEVTKIEQDIIKKFQKENNITEITEKDSKRVTFEINKNQERLNLLIELENETKKIKREYILNCLCGPEKFVNIIENNNYTDSIFKQCFNAHFYFNSLVDIQSSTNI